MGWHPSDMGDPSQLGEWSDEHMDTLREDLKIIFSLTFTEPSVSISENRPKTLIFIRFSDL